MAPELTKIDPKFGPVVFLAEKSKIKKVKRSTNLNYSDSYQQLKQKVGNQQSKEKTKTSRYFKLSKQLYLYSSI